MSELVTVWLNGGSALILICIAWAFAALFFYYYFKKNSKNHLFIGLLAVAVALGWTGITITFLSVAIHGYNLPGVRGIISYFSYSTIPLGAACIIYVNWDVFGSPKNKKPVITGFLIYSVFYFIILYTTFQQAVVVSDTGIIYDDWITPLSLFYYILWGQILIALIITEYGFNKFRKATAGELNTRAKYIMIATFFLGSAIPLDTVILMEYGLYLLFIPRLMMIIGLITIHLGYRPSK